MVISGILITNIGYCFYNKNDEVKAVPCCVENSCQKSLDNCTLFISLATFTRIPFLKIAWGKLVIVK
jgi:hypothetical protein